MTLRTLWQTYIYTNGMKFDESSGLNLSRKVHERKFEFCCEKIHKIILL